MAGYGYDDAWLATHGYDRFGKRVAQAAAMPADTAERNLLGQVRRIAIDNGWSFYHTWRSDHSEAGFPDCVLVKPGRLIFAELKSRTGKLTQAQETWLSLLQHSLPDVEVYTWRPTDWPAIQTLLTRRP